MEVFVTRTSNWDWYRFKTFDTIESIFQFAEKNGDIILSTNFHYKDDYSFLTSNHPIMSEDDAKRCTKCKYTIEIYDDYRE